MSFNLKVKKAIVLIMSGGRESISLELDSPTPFPTMQYLPSATVAVQAGHGVKWVKETFPGMEPEVIRVP